MLRILQEEYEKWGRPTNMKSKKKIQKQKKMGEKQEDRPELRIWENVLNINIWEERTSRSKQILYRIIVESILTYGSECWQIAVETEFFRRACKYQRYSGIQMKKPEDEQKEYIQTRYRHMLRMEEELIQKVKTCNNTRWEK